MNSRIGGKRIMKKKIMALLICCMVLGLTQSVYAMEPEDCNGDLSIEEGAEEYVLTVEDALRNEQKWKNIEQMKKRSAPSTVSYTLDVPTFQQEKNYYCGPATVKQTIHFLNGSSNSQSFYAGENDLNNSNKLGTTSNGTDMTRIAPVLRYYTGADYNYVSIGTYNNWCEQIIGALSTGLPPIIDINTKNVSAWPYSTLGHFLNISGYSSNPYTISVRVTDPFEKGLGNHWYSGTVVYQANNNHFRQAMIW